MNEMAGVRKKLRRVLEQDVPDRVWEDADIRDMAREYLAAEAEEDQREAWGALEDGVRRALRFWNGGREEVLRVVQSPRGASRDMREAEKRDTGAREHQSLDARELVSGRTKAMTGAMSALFALFGDPIPEVKEFRDRVLPGRFLSADEAHALIASRAARIFDLRLFEKWNISVVEHDWDLVEHVTSSDRGGVYMRATVRVDPPGITRTVRYVDDYNSLTEEDVADTRPALAQSGATIPLITGLPIEKRGRHTYPSWLWPGSVVDELYDLSVVLASAFDWPLASAGNLWGSRPRSESAAWFILTGEVPQVRPIEARWEMKLAVISLLPQWRIQLTIPPWLPEEEVLRAFRSLRRERPAGHQMPKTAKPLEVARFVWKRKRVEYREPVPWTAWLEQWNEEHPGHRFSSASNLRTYFLRGVAAVKHLNFDPPNFELPRGSSDANRHHRERKTVQHAAMQGKETL
jgi:hypothetical protein